MAEKKTTALGKEQVDRLLSRYPERLFQTMLEIGEIRGTPVFLVGGALRDWYQGDQPTDLDFTISHGASEYLAQLRRELGEGTIVELGERSDDTCRLVFSGLAIDLSGFRKGSVSIQQDLACRDFTINGMAAALSDLVHGHHDPEIIDPLGGREDMQRKLIRACPGAFRDDPLRMLRAFRFAAQLDYEIEAQTYQELSDQVATIVRSAAERISYECDQIMLTPRAYQAMSGMAAAGLLEEIAPELWFGDRVSQPSFHHLDVLQHNLKTLDCMEQVFADLQLYFPDCPAALRDYLENEANRLMLKWAALFHDVGKPAVRKVNREKQDRITFYNHDAEGGRIFLGFAERLRWSKQKKKRVSEMINMHMHPFHLCNVKRQSGEISHRARLKICRRTGDDLAGLFMLAMADCLAGQGVDRPAGMERDLAELFCGLETLYQQTMRPLLSGPKLLTGADLIDTLGLSPGPLFKALLEGVETARIEGDISTRDEAVEWVRDHLKND